MDFLHDVRATIDVMPGWALQTLESLLILLFLLVGRRWACHVVDRRVEDSISRFRWRKTLTYLTAVLAIFLIGPLWMTGIRDIATYLGLLSAGVALALRDPLVNLAGWVFILSRHPFQVGDRIEVGDIEGDVIDVQMLSFSMLEVGNWVKAYQSTGRLVHIPNGWVFTRSLHNSSQGFRFIWDELSVYITFESDWLHAKALLSGIAERHTLQFSAEAERQMKEQSSTYPISYHTLTPCVYTSVVPHGVCLSLRYLAPVRGRRALAEALWEDILHTVACEERITIAYPTQRVTWHENGPVGVETKQGE